MKSKSIRGALAGLLCTAAVAALSINNETFFGAEWLLRDWIAARQAQNRPPDPRIVIVAISDAATRALADYGRPQTYTRELYALAIEELRRAGASVVAIDVLLAEENANDPEGDRHLASALQAGRVVLGIQTAPTNDRAAAATLPPELLWRVRGDTSLEPSGAILPLGMFRAPV